MSDWLHATSTYYKTAAEERWVTVDLANQLATGETLTGTPTVTPESGSGLTCASPTVSGNTVVFKMSGGTVQAEPWCVTVQCATTQSAGAGVIERFVEVVVGGCG